MCVFNYYSLKLSNVLLAESFIRLLHFAIALYCCAFAALFIGTSSSFLILMQGFDTIDGVFEYGIVWVMQYRGSGPLIWLDSSKTWNHVSGLKFSPSPPNSGGRMSRAIISWSVERFDPCSFIRERVFAFKNGLMTDNAASTNQGWPMKWIPLKRIGKESCESRQELIDKSIKFP